MNSYHWAQGIIDFLHNGSQVLRLTPWVVGGWKCIPRCSFHLIYLHSQPLHSGESWEAWGTGVPHLSTTYLNVLTEAPAPYFSSHRENWALGFLFSVASCQKHFFSDLDHKVREEHRARPPWNTYQYYNSSFRIHCCYVNKAAGEIGSLGNWEMRLALATWQMFPSLRTMALWHQPTFFYLSFLLLIYRKIEQQNNGP